MKFFARDFVCVSHNILINFRMSLELVNEKGFSPKILSPKKDFFYIFYLTFIFNLEGKFL